ncbi:MAG: DUF2318 domain-containing protein [Peptococcaceae bacterium]|jgi:hypothetical protein|nr:DUF2318 domain-containing protein [Peptococcaceae bacterium]
MSRIKKNQSLNRRAFPDKVKPSAGQNQRTPPAGTQNKKAPDKQRLQAVAVVLIVIAFAAAIFVLRSARNGEGGGRAAADSGAAGGGAVPVVTDGDLVISVAEISEAAKFYPVEIDGTQLEVIAAEAPDGTVRTAFNTCQVCYDSGRGYYEQSGDVLVCQNCGNRIRRDQVEVQSGGCNPVPSFADNKTVTDETITISYDFLKESKDIFANWKTEY